MAVQQCCLSDCGICGNEAADRLAKKGSDKDQVDLPTTYKEASTAIKALQNQQWQLRHPKHNRRDAYYLLSRSEQVLIFRLRTGHTRLNHHLYTKLHIGETDMCPCQTASMTVSHILQECPRFTNLRSQTWSSQTPVEKKLHGSLEDLQRPASFLKKTGLTI